MSGRPPYLAVSSRVRRSYDGLADGYDALLGWAHPGYARAIPLAWQALARDLEAAEVLEIGPGTGYATSGLVAAAPGRVFAVDLSLRMLRRARRRATAGWLVGDVCRGLPLRAGSFDLVAGQYVFGHLEDVARALDEMFRVLRPGGWLCLVGREARGLGRFGRWLNGTRGLDPATTSTALERAGFAEIAWDCVDPAAKHMRSRFCRVRARRPEARRTSLAGE